MRLKWIPWRFLIRRAAQFHGFLDPVQVLGRLERFAEPSEVWAPLELLRAGAVFHARGLINSRAIQHNMDWIWPYWVEQQFQPLGDSFIPRAFSLTHVNLTHRNWTAVGVPGKNALPVVDPRGLVTPCHDGWSRDCWVLDNTGNCLFPSRQERVDQWLEMERGVTVRTAAGVEGRLLESRVEVILRSGTPYCRIRYTAFTRSGGTMVLSLRPYNPEGISLVHRIRPVEGGHGWDVNGRDRVGFVPRPECCRYSCYREGDVWRKVSAPDPRTGVTCNVGMATAAALFETEPGIRREITVEVPLEHHAPRPGRVNVTAEGLWRRSTEGACTVRIPDARMQYLYETSLRTLILHSPGTIYAGPYTYKRFWFRDAVFVSHALLSAGLTRRVECLVSRFPERQTRSGFFLSQNGEWDSNGQVLWLLGRLQVLSGRMLPDAWREPVRDAMEWICRKRTDSRGNTLHAGLLPPGFSAEHLGLNDYYYWDDFWSVAGLRAASGLLNRWGDKRAGARSRDAANNLERCINRSLREVARRLGRQAMPASPSRRMDSGAVGSLAAGYPLRLWEPDDPRLLDTAEYIMNSCLIRGGFYHDIIHSGINPYLTLHIAQVLLRAYDSRYFSLMRAIAELASSSGQWPEAVHPRTAGGCMGDGQHAWAAAEWVLMIRNCFLREEAPDRLILCSGIPREWRTPGKKVFCGPAPTPWGPVSVSLVRVGGRTRVSWIAEWRDSVPRIEVRLPGREPVFPEPGRSSVDIPEPGAHA